MVDMHIHTNNSDGQYSTVEIVKMLKLLKAELFSITDHDNIDACKELENIDIGNMIYIPGIELSSKNNKYNCHILGYNIDYNNIDLIKECEIIKQRRIDKIKIIIEHLKTNHNIFISKPAQDKLLNKQGITGRFDICKILMEKGYGEKAEIYDKYLTNIKGITSHRSDIESTISVIKKSNGIAILAHPKEIEENYKTNIEDFIKDFIEKGIDGIEVYNTIHTIQDIRRYKLIAEKYNLLITGGSDFHGAAHPERKLGKTTQYRIILNSSNLRLH